MPGPETGEPMVKDDDDGRDFSAPGVPISGGHRYVSVPVSPSPPREPHHLPSGRHGLSREEVLANQRTRVLEAVADVSSTAGFGPMTVEDIVVTAGISRRSFYDLFSSKDDAFLASLEDATEQLFEAIDEAHDGSGGFAGRIEACLRALLKHFAERPSYADMCLVQVMSAGPDAVDRRNATLRRFAALICTVADEEVPKRGRPPEIIAEAEGHTRLECVFCFEAAGFIKSNGRAAAILLDGLHPEGSAVARAADTEQTFHRGYHQFSG